MVDKITTYEPVIGIEVHVELNTKTKLFSPGGNDFHAMPNTNVNVYDLAYPGTLPVLNEQALINAIRLAKSLGMEIDRELHFDRKNYFYFDLPKGFQITQYFRPIARHGHLPIDGKDVKISHFHLEEDTASSSYDESGLIKLDFNRSGVPLIEIVSEPCLHSVEETVAYVELLRLLVRKLGISDGKLEEGSFRVDVNVSVRPQGTTTLGTKVEIKNLNSMQRIANAIKFEIDSQSETLSRGEKVISATKRHNAKTGENIVMRTKNTIADYRYFPEPNIPPVKISELINKVTALPELPWNEKKRYLAAGINAEHVERLLEEEAYSTYLDAADTPHKVLAANFFFNEIIKLANSQNKRATELKLKPSEFAAIINGLGAEKLSSRDAKKLISDYEIGNENFATLLDKIATQRTEHPTLEIMGLLKKLIEQNQDFINANKTRPERITKFLIGMAMKETRGAINPQSATELLVKLLDQSEI